MSKNSYIPNTYTSHSRRKRFSKSGWSVYSNFSLPLVAWRKKLRFNNEIHMGEFSDYFEAFPEENPANQDQFGRYVSPERRAEMERLRIANEKLNAALLRNPLDLPTPPPNKPGA